MRLRSSGPVEPEPAQRDGGGGGGRGAQGPARIVNDAEQDPTGGGEPAERVERRSVGHARSTSHASAANGVAARAKRSKQASNEDDSNVVKSSAAMSLPYELWVQILRDVGLSDLVQVMRVNKYLRKLLTTKTTIAQEIWRSAAEAAKFPKLSTSNFDIIAIVSFFEDTYCHACGKGGAVVRYCSFNLRLHPRCHAQFVCSEKDVRQEIDDLHPDALLCTPYVKVAQTKCRVLDSVRDTSEYLHGLDMRAMTTNRTAQEAADNEREDFLVEQEELQNAILKDNELLERWAAAFEQQKKQEKRDRAERGKQMKLLMSQWAARERYSFIVDEVTKLGYQRHLPMQSDLDGVLRKPKLDERHDWADLERVVTSGIYGRARQSRYNTILDQIVTLWGQRRYLGPTKADVDKLFGDVDPSQEFVWTDDVALALADFKPRPPSPRKPVAEKPPVRDKNFRKKPAPDLALRESRFLRKVVAENLLVRYDILRKTPPLNLTGLSPFPTQCVFLRLPGVLPVWSTPGRPSYSDAQWQVALPKIAKELIKASRWTKGEYARRVALKREKVGHSLAPSFVSSLPGPRTSRPNPVNLDNLGTISDSDLDEFLGRWTSQCWTGHPDRPAEDKVCTDFLSMHRQIPDLAFETLEQAENPIPGVFLYRPTVQFRLDVIERFGIPDARPEDVLGLLDALGPSFACKHHGGTQGRLDLFSVVNNHFEQCHWDEVHIRDLCYVPQPDSKNFAQPSSSNGVAVAS
ncbi:hypothetical protein JCM10212_006416 [Sporobolomyces blumeae]